MSGGFVNTFFQNEADEFFFWHQVDRFLYSYLFLLE